jgi:hypothetical protein
MSSKLRQTHIVSIIHHKLDKQRTLIIDKYCITYDTVIGIIFGAYIFFKNNCYEWISICYEGFSIDVVDEGVKYYKEYFDDKLLKVKKVMSKDMYTGLTMIAKWYNVKIDIS